MNIAGILGTGSALPEKVITNSDLEKLVDTSDQWIIERTGIRERRQAAPNETTSTLCIQAARKALAMAGLSPTDLDMIICSTISPDMPLPSTAAFIQRGLGARTVLSFDLAAACSRFLDYQDRATCVLFGDGVAAGIIGPVSLPSGILATEMHTDGAFAEHLYIPAGGAAKPASCETVRAR